MPSLKAFGKWLSRHFPGALDLLLDSRFGGMRRAFTTRIPGLAEAIAGVYFFRGADDLARRELLNPDGSLRDCVVSARIREMDMVLDRRRVSDPRPAEGSHQGELRPACVVHALDNSLAASSSGYAHRSHVLLKALTMAGLQPVAFTRPGYPRQLPVHTSGSEARQTVDMIEYRSIEPGSDAYERMPEIDYISRYADELVRAAAECRAPIVHAHSNYLNGLAAAWAARRAGGASVYEIRGLWHLTRAALEPAFAATRLYAYQAQMELQAMSQVDRVIVPSPVMREWLVGEGVDAGRISLVPYSANLATITPMAGNTELVKQLGLEGKFILGFVGSITGYEGLDTVLAAIDTCAKRGLDAVLVLVGDGPALPGLRRLARRLGIARRLVEIGRVPGQDVPKYYSIFDVCPVVRRDVAVCRLVSPLKPAEIMAAGKPMIVSALPSLLEYGEEGTSRVSVPPDDAGQLADCIMSLSRDRARLVLLGTEARQWAVRHLDDHDIGARYAAIYRELLDRPKPQMPTG